MVEFWHDTSNMREFEKENNETIWKLNEIENNFEWKWSWIHLKINDF